MKSLRINTHSHCRIMNTQKTTKTKQAAAAATTEPYKFPNNNSISSAQRVAMVQRWRRQITGCNAQAHAYTHRSDTSIHSSTWLYTFSNKSQRLHGISSGAAILIGCFTISISIFSFVAIDILLENPLNGVCTGARRLHLYMKNDCSISAAAPSSLLFQYGFSVIFWAWMQFSTGCRICICVYPFCAC